MKERRRREREEAKQLTRRALMEAGLEEIIEHGLDAGLDGICARAGYTRGAFYVHFKDREDFLVAITELVLGTIIGALLNPSEESASLGQTVTQFGAALNSSSFPLDVRIRVATVRLMDAIDRWPKLSQTFSELTGESIARLTTLAAKEQQEGRIRRDIDANELGNMLVIVSLGAVLLNKVGVPIDHVKQAALIMELISGEVSPRSGKRRK